jgi:hypothetical protein
MWHKWKMRGKEAMDSLYWYSDSQLSDNSNQPVILFHLSLPGPTLDFSKTMSLPFMWR